MIAIGKQGIILDKFSGFYGSGLNLSDIVKYFI